MYEQVEKPKENKSRAVANSVAQKKSNVKQGFGFVDNSVRTLQFFKLSVEKTKIKDALKDVERLLWIDLENSRWIPNADPYWNDGTSKDTDHYTKCFTKLINDGWPLSISDLMEIVPLNATNNWVPEERIQVGFKYNFTDGNGVKWVVRGHAPELNRANSDEVGSLFWTVRIQRGKDHLLSEPVAIDVKQTKFSQWRKNIKGKKKVRLAHIVATPS